VNLIPGAHSASQGLRAEQVRLEVISQNIANARTTKTADGGPYQRQAVRFKAALGDAMSAQAAAGKNPPRSQHRSHAQRPGAGAAGPFDRKALIPESELNP